MPTCLIWLESFPEPPSPWQTAVVPQRETRWHLWILWVWELSRAWAGQPMRTQMLRLDRLRISMVNNEKKMFWNVLDVKLRKGIHCKSNIMNSKWPPENPSVICCSFVPNCYWLSHRYATGQLPAVVDIKSYSPPKFKSRSTHFWGQKLPPGSVENLATPAESSVHPCSAAIWHGSHPVDSWKSPCTGAPWSSWTSVYCKASEALPVGMVSKVSSS